MRDCVGWLSPTLSVVMAVALGCATPEPPDVSAGHSRVGGLQTGDSGIAWDLRLEACATPSQLYTPGGDSAQVEIRAADTRLHAAIRQSNDGLIATSDAVLVELLCEWPDAASKALLLDLLATNREVVGDLEGALRVLRLASKTDAGRLPIVSGLKLAWMVRIAEHYRLLSDRAQLEASLADLEAVLVDQQKYFEGQNSPLPLVPLAQLFARVGDVRNAERALSRLEVAFGPRPSYLEAFGAPRKSYLDLWFDGQHLRIARALVSLAYVESRQYGEATRLAGRVIRQRVRFQPWMLGAEVSWAMQVHKVDVLLDAIPEGGTAVALEALVRVSIARGDGETALQLLKELERSIRYIHESLRAGLKGLTRVPESRRLIALFETMVGPRGYLSQANLAWLNGQALLLAGKTEEAGERNRHAVEIIEGLRGLLSREDRVTFFSTRTGPYYSLVDSLLPTRSRVTSAVDGGGVATVRSGAGEAFAYADAARARLLSEQLADLRAARPQSGEGALPEGVLLREQELRARVRAELRSGKRLEDASAYLEFKRFVGRLHKEFPEYAELSYPVPVTVADVPVRADEVVIGYALLEHRLAIWVFQQGREVRSMVVRVRREQVAKRIRDLLASVRPDEMGALPRFDAAASTELYGWLLAAPLKAVRAGTRLVIIADGELATLPFEVLSPDGRELGVERHTIVYAPSASVLRHQRRMSRGKVEERDRGGRALLVGDPDYGMGSERENEAGVALSPRVQAIQRYADARGLGMFSRLGWTEREVRKVAATLGAIGTAQDVLLGLQANEYDIKRLDLGAYRFIHVAAHGVLAGDIPYLRQPALVLAQGGDLRGEDGFLTMSEVVNLRLRAEVTVLSACQTGLGASVLGEGVVGLMRAFLYAGSRSVVGSLWQVDDESTAALMGSFYRNLAEGRGVSDALRLAKIELRSVAGGRWEHPFYWGAFVVFGPE